MKFGLNPGVRGRESNSRPVDHKWDALTTTLQYHQPNYMYTYNSLQSDFNWTVCLHNNASVNIMLAEFGLYVDSTLSCIILLQA